MLTTAFLVSTSARLNAGVAQNGECNACRTFSNSADWIRVPSVAWQFLWATVFGPYILLRIRDINDTHYWAWQTRLAILAW